MTEKARNKKCVCKHLSEGNSEVFYGGQFGTMRRHHEPMEKTSYSNIFPFVQQFWAWFLGVVASSKWLRCSGFRSVTSVFTNLSVLSGRGVDIVDTWRCSVDSFVFWKCSQLKMCVFPLFQLLQPVSASSNVFWWYLDSSWSFTQLVYCCFPKFVLFRHGKTKSIRLLHVWITILYTILGFSCLGKGSCAESCFSKFD